MLSGDVVALWEVALSDGVYRIEFAHGTTTGKRVVYVNGKVSHSIQKSIRKTLDLEETRGRVCLQILESGLVEALFTLR